LEDREAIRELVARYAFTVDDRDVAGIAALFTRDGAMRSNDGVMNAAGREAVVEQFHARFRVLGPTLHVAHDHLIWFDEADATRAFGLVSSHAEVVRHGRPMWAAIRYRDEYRVEDGAWRFRDRLLSFFYYVNPAEYAEALLSPLRNRAYAEPKPADVPEGVATYREYYRK
jgi:ketosteroid isomerase-like protein